MPVTFYWYPNCGTCKKAKKWLEDEGVEFKPVHIVNDPPSEGELKKLIALSDQPAKKFFNTSGKKYRELNMKEKLKEADENQMIQWLATDGMLIKRPIISDDENVTVGFKPDEYEKVWAQ